MNDVVIRVEKISKEYRLGVINYNTLSENLQSNFAKFFGREDPNSKIDEQYLGQEKKYNTRFWALKDISFEVRRGEILGIIGRNGAGKSTLLKILSRVTAPTNGIIKVHGRIASLLEVGTGFHPELTGRENIFLNGAILGMRKHEIENKFDEIVHFAEIEKFIDTPVKRYSSGMYVRLAFAVAAHLEPEILLIDEVLAVGDASFQKKCLGKMSDVAKEGRTVLFVSHNMGAITSLCSRAILIETGLLTRDDSCSIVVSEYLATGKSHNTSDCLINHPNRTKGYNELLTYFSTNSNDNVVYYGEPLICKIGYSFNEKIVIPQFVIIFFNILGVKVFTLISDYQKNNIPNFLVGTGEIICNIPALPLMPGEYSISLMLWQPGQKLDEIENVTDLHVEWRNREIGQFNWDNSMGLVYVEADWKCIKYD